MRSSAAVERSLLPELSLVDIVDDFGIHANGDVSLFYRLETYHEPSMDDADFDAAAFAAENAWSGLPEETRYQFYVSIDHSRGIRHLNAALPAIPDQSQTGQLFDEFRRARLKNLTRRAYTEGREILIQDRRHYLVATFHPLCLKRTALQRGAAFLRELLGDALAATLGAEPLSSYEEIYERIRQEATSYDRRITRALSAQHGLELRRMPTPDIAEFLHSFLSPTAADRSRRELAALSHRARANRDNLPQAILAEEPFLSDISPLLTVADDDLRVYRDYLRLGNRFVSVITLKEMPDRTEPGLMVPMLRMGREKYWIVYSVDIPARSKEITALRKQAAMAEGMRRATLVKTDRTDPHADAMAKQTNDALAKMFASSQRVFGVTLQVLLIERTPEDLDDAVQETLSSMSAAQGMRGYREAYMLKQAFLSLLPGAPRFVERRRKALTPEMVDMAPVYDFHSGRVGRGVPFVTPANAVIYYDPFDSNTQSNANILVTGTSGAGKSVVVQMILSGYEIAAACHGKERPYTFILDNGASYKRYMDLRDDARYVEFRFDEPPGVDVFEYDPQLDDRNEHVSRLQWLLVSLLRIDQSNEDELERNMAVLEKALLALYPEAGEPQAFTRDFAGLAEALRGASVSDRGRDLAERTEKYTRGKFQRLFEPNDALALQEDVRAVCYDFRQLAEHPDFALAALRLVIYTIRRFSARMHRRKRARSFLVLDESWALLDAGTGGAAMASMAAPFLAASFRQGRKEGISTIAISQTLADFSSSAYGAAILGNTATKILGHPGSASVEAIQKDLGLSDRQAAQLRGLVQDKHFREFLLIQGAITNVIRVPLDSFSRWVFTTSPDDRERIDQVTASRPDLPLLDHIRLLANGA